MYNTTSMKLISKIVPILMLFGIIESVVCQDCKLPNCFDPGTSYPLEVSRTPQFVLLSHDDAINTKTWNAFQSTGRCGVKTTFFVSWENTNCDYIKAFYNAGHEIALHTMSHAHLTGVPLEDLKTEMLGVRDMLYEKCGVPYEEMIGFRPPYLEINENVRNVLVDDPTIRWSSDLNHYIDGADLNGTQLWPFTMDSGFVKNSSLEHESHPGFWEIPLNPIMSEIFNPVYSMDPGRITSGTEVPEPHDGDFIPADDLMDLLIENFNGVYNNKRSPFAINFHTPWLMADGYAQILTEFLDYTKSFDDVYFVTFSELIEWMKNPVPLEKMPPRNLECVPEIIPPKSFWEKYNIPIIVTAISIGPVITISICILIAQFIFIVMK